MSDITDWASLTVHNEGKEDHILYVPMTSYQIIDYASVLIHTFLQYNRIKWVLVS